MADFEIVTDIVPCPEAAKARIEIPFNQLERGQHFRRRVDLESGETLLWLRKWLSARAAAYQRKTPGQRFAIRVIEHGEAVGVWRVE